MGRFSKFTTSASRPFSGLASLGDTYSCERALLADLANQYFYALGSGDDVASRNAATTLKSVFERAYLLSSGAAESVLTQDERLFYLQSYLAEKYPAMFDQIMALPLNESAFKRWSSTAALRVPTAYSTRAQAEASILACTSVQAQAERDRVAQAERDRVAQAERDRVAQAERDRVAQATRDAAARDAATRDAAARDAATRDAAARDAATRDAAARDAATRDTLVLRPVDPRIFNTIQRRHAITESASTNYTPWLIGGGLLLAAALVASAKMKTSVPKIEVVV